MTDHHEIEVEFRGEKVTVNREFYRKEDKNYSTTEQDDNVIWAALRAWCEKKGITAFELYPKQPEQPAEMDNEEKIRNFFDAIGDCGFSQYDILRLKSIWEDAYSTSKEQSVEGLEEEIDKYIQPIQAWEVQEAPFISLENCARHFAEWGAEHLRDSTKMIDEGLEEAAREYAKEYTKNEGNGGDDWEDDIQITFKTGAEWMKAKMMEEAVEKYVHELYTDEEGYHCYISLGTEYAPGDKVRVIVIKEGEK